MIRWLLNLLIRPPKPPALKQALKLPLSSPRDPDFQVRVVPQSQNAYHWTIEYRHLTPFWIRLTKAHIDSNIHPNRWNLTHPWLFDSHDQALNFSKMLTYDFVMQHLKRDREEFNAKKHMTLEGIASRCKFVDVFPRKPLS